MWKSTVDLMKVYSSSPDPSAVAFDFRVQCPHGRDVEALHLQCYELDGDGSACHPRRRSGNGFEATDRYRATADPTVWQ